MDRRMTAAVFAAGAATGAAIAVFGPSAWHTLQSLRGGRFDGGKRLSGDTREQQLISHVFAHAKRGDAESVLREIDAFCASHWMMNLGGGDKGATVRAVVSKAVTEGKVKLAAEFGGYCGYSAVLFGSLLPAGSKFISIEINPVYAAIATKIIEFAGLADKVEVLVSDVPAALAEVRERFGEGSLDLAFIDHWKMLYLPHFKELERSKLLHVGSVILADNVITPGAPDYLAYVQASPHYRHHLHDGLHLEYSTERDAISECVVLTLPA